MQTHDIDWRDATANLRAVSPSITNPAADGSKMRTARYSAQADRRAWASMRTFSMRCLAAMLAGPVHA
jgi:hypothetical protein